MLVAWHVWYTVFRLGLIFLNEETACQRHGTEAWHPHPPPRPPFRTQRGLPSPWAGGPKDLTAETERKGPEEPYRTNEAAVLPEKSLVKQNGNLSLVWE